MYVIYNYTKQIVLTFIYYNINVRINVGIYYIIYLLFIYIKKSVKSK